ncbi:OLC1v1038822C2 [Oldenlandia corymbosa var. corymbosa]|uniref:OLC1v1038822C2 n=1 Tax=Oldenlandia corymbosa var. corymbosa TaxID=529605 RepID=A0AAV1D0N3_OLDCO|nr:OLC1v1038822C2 [Oldenlandia corymbosa var. corymbosa]
MADVELEDSSLPQSSDEEAVINGKDDDGDTIMPGAGKPAEDSDSDSDSDSDDEAQINLQVQTLESQLFSNPADYDAHVQYIRALRKQGDVEKLRHARETMSDLFPLTPDMWREWVRDETAMSSGAEALPAIEKLYERGVSDYLSVDLWCDYLDFLCKHDPVVREGSADGSSKLRNVFERAVVAAGLHVVEGSKIYETYRSFAQAHLSTMGEADTESKDKSLQNIRTLFYRQLSVPLANLESTLTAYKTWEAEQGISLDLDPNSLDGLPSPVAAAYQKALDALNARTHFEEKIARQDDSERLQHFMTYLKFEQSLGDPARVQILFERAITEYPINHDLWLDYTHYLDKTIKTSSIVRGVYSRATRNCPWVGELWVWYLRHLERVRASEEEISMVFEKSLQCTFGSYDVYLDIFLTRVDGLRRKISLAAAAGERLEFSMIKDVFQRASDYLSPHLEITDILRMSSYWARLEVNLGKNMVAARGVWENVLKTSGSVLGAWEGYIAMEIAAGHINEARSLYKRCYSKRFSGTGSEDICHSWLQFEREYGSLEDFDVAIQKVSPRLAELQSLKLQQENKSAPPIDQRENTSRKNAGEKRKLHSDATEDKSRTKRHKDMTQKLQITDPKPKSDATDSVEKAKVEVDSLKAENSSKGDTHSRPAKKPKYYDDQCTAFISNISLKATSDDIRAFFDDVGGVVDIRILTDKFTKTSRGLAYVDFIDDEHLAVALCKNKQTLLGKRISIAKSNPRESKKKGTASNTSEHGTTSNRAVDAEQSDSKHIASGSQENAGFQAKSAGQKGRDERGEFRGRNTFAVPRSVRPLRKSGLKPGASKDDGDEEPKSNDEFRKMLLKK